MTKKKYGIRTVNGNEPDPETGDVEVSVGGSQDLQQTLENGNISNADIPIILTTSNEDTRWTNRIESNIIEIKREDILSGIEKTINVDSESGFTYNNDQSGKSSHLNDDFLSISDTENVTLYGSKVIQTTNFNSGSNFVVKFPDVIGSEITHTASFQDKDGTLATLDDITLQKALNGGGGLAYIDSPSLNSGVSTDIRATDVFSNLILTSRFNHEAGVLALESGKVILYQVKDDGNLTSRLLFKDPIDNNTNFYLPAKVSGNYDLATLDDIKSPTLQNVLESGNNAIGMSMSIGDESKAYSLITANTISNLDAIYGRRSDVLPYGFFISSENDNNRIAYYTNDVTYATQDDLKSNKLIWKRLTDGKGEYKFPEKPSGTYTLATLDDITTNSPVSGTTTGLVDNTSLQELGGVDKLINGIRIGKGGGNLTTNVVLGDYSLFSNSTGNNSTAVGYESLYSNTTGAYNTGIGSFSLYYNTTGLVNTSIGAYSSTSNTTGSYNTAIGASTLNANQFGSANVAIGASALKSNVGVSGSNIFGHRSIAIGSNAMYNNTTGNGISIGDTSLRSQTTGMYNIAIGLQAGSGITTGNANVIVADTGFIAAGGGITTGSNNLIIAPNNGNTTGITTGSGNVVLGKVTGLSASASNTITISDGVGNVAITKSTTGELKTPNLTQALIVSGGATSLVTKGYVDNTGAIDNVTTTVLSSATLTTTYPNALSGFRVRCLNITNGALTYEKTVSGWIQYAITITQ
ncbi:hypothetical protein C8C83_3321 [Flavobacterium sp. 90]|uniref:hypothetical protein n=1 Tax=unclassified Flavobacterium TaxID=196869 RepID=UPI000EAE370D|nr:MULTISPECIES: hypothetical protein [unclassified Flavobacterium]RKR11581.1 hypothetical protein C8C82_3632 [Flavobacterium sp. 81]TCK55362.1 hypothetical protein C8C83_3321 [Flavobacterium sp. 90]